MLNAGESIVKISLRSAQIGKAILADHLSILTNLAVSFKLIEVHLLAVFLAERALNLGLRANLVKMIEVVFVGEALQAEKTSEFKLLQLLVKDLVELGHVEVHGNALWASPLFPHSGLHATLAD